MGELKLSGLSTGIDTSTLVKQLMAIERKRITAYTSRQETYTKKKEALSELSTKLDALKKATSDLSDAGSLRAYTTSSSDTDIVTAEANNTAFEGSHTVIVKQLATLERWVHNSGLEYAESEVGAGTFIYSYNNQEVMVTTTSETSLQELADLINNDPENAGVTASLLFYNGTYHLVLNGNDAGSDYAIKINASNTEVWQTLSSLTVGTEDAALSDKIVSLDQFSGVLAGDESITITGTTHDGVAVSNTLMVTERTTLSHLIKEIDDAFAGTAKAVLVNGQIRLVDATNGVSQMQLSLTYNAGSGGTSLTLPTVSRYTQGGSVSANLSGFGVDDFIQTQVAQDSKIKVDGYPLGEDEWITRSSNTVSDVIRGVTLHLHHTGTVNVGLTRDTETVKKSLKAWVDAYNEVASFVDKNTSYDKEKKEGGPLMSDQTISSLLNNLRLTLIQRTRGFVIDVDSFLMPGQIGVELDGDGLLNLKTSALSDALTKDYRGVLDLIGANKTGGSDSNVIKFYGASNKNTTAGAYKVEVTISGGTITGARIRSENDTVWRDASFYDNIVMGDNTFDEYNRPLYPENGLQLSVDLSQDGTFTATVRVKQGFTGAMENVLDNVMDKTRGMLTLNQNEIQSQIKRLQDQIDKEEKRLTQVEERLSARYARLEKSLTLLQNQFAALVR
ncbi:MAG TPA: flagellar filament capping protein FliD [Sedimentisphaerales bacterium]|nr:flagellar filament capping protein FliD [Sedimentisphaerales bacterium]